MNLAKLSEPFWPGDIEWRPSQSKMGRDGKPWCKVLAYVTARAIADRLDKVCGPANWCNTKLEVHSMGVKTIVMQVGISIRMDDGTWITKYDVAEPTNIEAAKGGFSGAMKRAGQQWGIARYLYHLDETYAKVITPDEYRALDSRLKPDWKNAKLAQKRDGDDPVYYYWQAPDLPGWALPKDPATGVKRLWMQKFAPNETRKDILTKMFSDYVFNIVGKFPIDDPACWTDEIVAECEKRISATKNGGKGPSSDVPFE